MKSFGKMRLFANADSKNQKGWVSIIRFMRQSLAALAVVFLGLLYATPADAQTPYLPAVKNVQSPLISPTDAWTYYSANGGSTSGTAPTRSQYIKDLARDLKQDPDLIYEFVRNRIEIVPMFGLQKGAVGAILTGHGTAFDQAHLMIELLREASFVANYKYGTISLTANEFGKWFGVIQSLNEANQTFTVDAKAACRVLADGGIPATVNGQNDCNNVSGALATVTLAHVWVEVEISGSAYQVDPSYKSHTFKAGIGDLGTIAFQYDETSLLGKATCSGASCTSFDLAGMEAQLQGYAESLAAYIKSQNVGWRLVDLLGGMDEIIPHDGTPITSTSLQGYAATSTWGNHVPDVFRTKLTVTLLGHTSSVYADHVAGKSLWLEQKKC